MTIWDRLERLERIAQDTKKEFRYNKQEGAWYWMNRDDVDTPEHWRGEFDTRLEALEDAIAPYEDDYE